MATDPPPPDASRPFDVAIAGAGLAGASLALRLARTGARVALLDPGVFPRDKLCGEFLSPESWGCWSGWAWPTRWPARATSRSAGCASRRRGAASWRPTSSGPDGRPGIGLSRSVLDDLLVRRARAAGAEVFECLPGRRPR
jgi:flavin-dependent dehydrogenase